MRGRSAEARRATAWLAVLLTLFLAGCATQTRTLLQGGGSGLPRQAELTSTPFHPQERFQCGPAALAMALNAAGVRIAPEVLVPQVYVPHREGSLPPEMLAAARRNGAVALNLQPRLDILLAEIAAGNPVIVLQNLSLPAFPLWHYAVAIGYDLDNENIILRSGTTERLVMPLSTFENTWARSGYWSMVALPPGKIPATADEVSMAGSLVAFEKPAGPLLARQAYEHAVQRWPRNHTLLMGLGNAAYASGDLAGAESAFRKASEVSPGDAAALNNLATVLAEMGQLERAEEIAGKAVTFEGPWKQSAVATLQAIRSARKREGRGP